MENQPAQEKYIVSACLAGVQCRYDGKTKTNQIIERLIRENRAILVCPEQLGGLPTPREACECRRVDGEIRVFSKSGRDYTENFRRGAETVLMLAEKYGIKKAILQKNSPSCGVVTYDGTFSRTLTDYAGITAQLLMEHGIEVISSADLEELEAKL